MIDLVEFNDYKSIKREDRLMLNIEQPLEELDNFIMGTIKKRNWDMTLQSYEDIVREMMDYTRIHRNELPTIKLDKLYQTMRFLIEKSKFDKLKNQVIKMGQDDKESN